MKKPGPHSVEDGVEINAIVVGIVVSHCPVPDKHP
jgi:hypothetical protein